MFKKSFSFQGRIRRTEYGLSLIIFYLGLWTMVMGLSQVLPQGEILGGGVILCLIPCYWFLIAQGAKRCHDLGQSGWFQLIPFYGLWMLLSDSDFGENKYGLNPKGEGNHHEIDTIGNDQSE